MSDFPIDSAVAVQILGPDAARDEWLAERMLGIGGSDVSALVGLNNYRSTGELFLEKTGQLPRVDEPPSEAAEMGTLLEPVIRDRFAREYGLTVLPAGMWRSVQRPYMQANPDGLIPDEAAGYEGKTASFWLRHEWEGGQTADHAELQAQWGMAVTGLRRWYVAVLIAGQRNEYRVIERDEDLIATLTEVAERFWHEHVLTTTPPDWDGSAAATAYLQSRHPVAEDDIAELPEPEADELERDREKTQTALKDAQADVDAVKNRARGMLGNRSRLMCGQRELATWFNNGPFSEKTLRANYPDLAASYTRPQTVEAVDTAALEAEHPEVYRACRARRLLFK